MLLTATPNAYTTIQTQLQKANEQTKIRYVRNSLDSFGSLVI